MKAIFAYNYTKSPAMDKVEIGGGPTSAFTKYKISPATTLPPIKNPRKDAFRKIKIMFGLAESCGASKK